MPLVGIRTIRLTKTFGRVQALTDVSLDFSPGALHGVIGPDFLRVGGKALEGMLAPSGPFPVAEQLPDSSPIKKTALDFKALHPGGRLGASLSTHGCHTEQARNSDVKPRF